MSDDDLTQCLQESGLFGVSSAHNSSGIEAALEKLAVLPLNSIARELLKDK